jgi:PAS domain S-box-containing protein
MEKDLATTREEVSHKEEEIRARERFLASVVRSIDDGVVSLDFDGRIINVNEGACRLFRRTETEMIGQDFNLLIRDTEYREKRRIIARSTYRTGHWRGEVEILRKDGTAADALLSTAKIIDERGKPIGFVSSFKDLTESKAMQHKMLQSEKLAPRPDGGGGGARDPEPSRVHQDEPAAAAGRAARRGEVETVEHIRDAVGSMEVIVNELLDYTREIALQTDEYDVSRIVRSAVFGMEEDWKRKGVEVTVTDGEGSCSANVDGIRIKQVVTNIVKNAVEAAPAGAGRVEVRVSGKDGFVHLAVADDGPGMQPDELAKVFQPFYTTKAQGVGLGMPIVRRLVELHGGEVRVDSEAGKGTAVTVKLPRFPFGAGGGGR